MTESVLTTSVGLLTHNVAFRPVFSPVPLTSDEAFDEGPIELRWKPDAGTSVSGSLNNLSSSYPFVQGVEITKQSQYVRGVFKIWSGDPQHRLRRTTFGQERVFVGNHYVESDRFSALSLVRDNVRSFTDDADGPIESYNLNGIIEPLTIRRNIVLSTPTNLEPRSVKGTLMRGTVDVDGGAVDVLSVDGFSIPTSVAGFTDGTMRRPDTIETVATIVPFSDARLVRSTPVDGTEPSDMIAALSEMTGSTDGYIRHDQRSAPCGWYYDNTRSGTDSLAFGGMTY